MKLWQSQIGFSVDAPPKWVKLLPTWVAKEHFETVKTFVTGNS
jgi:hypothetical protein